MTKKLSKKLISIFLSLMMVLSLIPTGMITAFADATVGTCYFCGHYLDSHKNSGDSAIVADTQVIGACSSCGGQSECAGKSWAVALEGDNNPMNKPTPHKCSNMTATHYMITTNGSNFRCKQYAFDSTREKWFVFGGLMSIKNTKFPEGATAGDGKFYAPNPESAGTYIECVEAADPCGLCVVCGHAKSEHGEYCEPCDMTNGPCNDESKYVACVLDKGHTGNHSDGTPEWVATITSKVDAVASELVVEDSGYTIALTDSLEELNATSFAGLVDSLTNKKYSQADNVYTIEGNWDTEKMCINVTLDEDENVASVNATLADSEGVYTDLTFTPAGPATCGLCANCGHYEEDHRSTYCSSCDDMGGACKSKNNFVACVLEKDHTGNHSATLPSCGLCVVCGHAEDKHDGACADCHGTKGNCRDKDNFVACALDEGHDGDHSLGTVEAPEWADDIMGKIDTVAEFCEYHFYGGSMTLADLMMNKSLAELLAEVADEVAYKQDGNNYYIYGIDSTMVYMFKAQVNENGDIIYITFAQTKNGSTESVEFDAPVPGTPCGKCINCGHKGHGTYPNIIRCSTCYDRGGVCYGSGEMGAKVCVLPLGHKGACSDTLPPCGKCTGCGHPWTKHGAERCSQCVEDMEGYCYIYISRTSGACVLPQGHTGPCSAHTHNSSAYGSNATQHWTKCTDDNDNNGTPANHTWSNGQCSVCNYTCQHSGGTATCTAAAVCSTCGESYGTALGHSYATTWSSDANTHWYAATCEHNTLKKDEASHTYGTEGTARYTCTVCSAVNEAKKLEAAKADAKAAIDAYLGESENEDADAVANKAKQDIDAATTVEDVNDIKAKALEDIKDIIAPDFKTLLKDLKIEEGDTYIEYKLTKDYTRAPRQQGVAILNGQKVVIDLNGHTIDGAEDDYIIGDFIFYVNPGAELVINDSTDNKGVITGGNGYYNSSVSRTYGGAIFNSGTLTINGGTFTGNTATSGGAIHNGNTLTINGGVFTNNTAYTQGGVVNNVNNNVVLTITGGTFTNNKSGYGGVIENYSGSVATIIGGTFTDNTASKNGGAIDSDSATLYIGGSAVIKDNVLDENLGTENEGNGITNNVEVYGATIALADTALTEDAEIGITLSAETDTLIAEGATLDTLKALKSDNADKMFIVDNGAVKIMNIADHVHAGGTATCQVLKVCQSCGASYGTYAQHSYTEYVSNNDATCTEDGTKTADCDYECGATSTITDEGTATGHHYTAEVTTAPTYNNEGVRTYTCTCGDSYNEKIDRLKVTAAIKYANSTRMDTGLILTSSKTDATIKWGKVADADGYMIYAAYCGNDAKLIKTIKGADTKSYKFAKLDGKAIDLTKNIKAYVVAYKVIDGKKVEFGQTIVAHAIGSQSKKYTNPVEVTVKSDKVTLSQGKTSTINATVTYKDASKKAISDAHSPEKRYRSSKKAVATVDKDGKITAVGKGTCTIYVFAKNGVSTKITVTVK